MIRRLRLEWPDAGPFRGRADDTIRVLAVSDEVDPSLERGLDHEEVGSIDVVLAAGDLPGEYLDRVAHDAHAPLVYVKGNHDAGAGWEERASSLPQPLRDARIEAESGLRVAGLSWPAWEGARAIHDETAAWFQAVPLAARALLRSRRPLLVVSHAPPLGAGDDPSAPFHTGFAAYRWLAHRLRPPLWLHGHTPLAAVADWRTAIGPTTIVNVTGAVLVELVAPTP